MNQSFDIPTKIHIFFNGQIESRTSKIQKMITEITNLVRDYNVKEINIYMNTSGGEISTAIYLSNFLKQFKDIIKFYNAGAIDSAGILIFLNCAKLENRFGISNGSFHIHGSSIFTPTPRSYYLNELKEQASHLEELEKQIIDIYTSKENETNITKKDCKKWFSQGSRISLEEAIKYKIISKEINNINKIPPKGEFILFY